MNALWGMFLVLARKPHVHASVNLTKVSYSAGRVGLSLPIIITFFRFANTFGIHVMATARDASSPNFAVLSKTTIHPALFLLRKVLKWKHILFRRSTEPNRSSLTTRKRTRVNTDWLPSGKASKSHGLQLEIYGNFASIFLWVVSRTLMLLKKKRL